MDLFYIGFENEIAIITNAQICILHIPYMYERLTNIGKPKIVAYNFIAVMAFI